MNKLADEEIKRRVECHLGDQASFWAGVRWAQSELERRNPGYPKFPEDFVLAQICPRCNGEGQVRTSLTTGLYEECRVCHGTQIIPIPERSKEPTK